MPFGSWFKGWNADGQPPEKSETVIVAESLLMELDFQIREAEQRERDNDREKQRQQSGVDYSWLVSVPPKKWEMPQLERLELEESCMKVKPTECGRIIQMFREALVREPAVPEIPRIMRRIVHQVLENRPKEETMGEWMMKSLVKLKPSPRISPLGIDDEESMELQKDFPKRARAKSMPEFKSPKFADDLPV